MWKIHTLCVLVINKNDQSQMRASNQKCFVPCSMHLLGGPHGPRLMVFLFTLHTQYMALVHEDPRTYGKLHFQENLLVFLLHFYNREYKETISKKLHQPKA